MSKNVTKNNRVKLDAATEVGWWMNVFDALPDATFVSHAQTGRIQVANRACKDLLGYDIGYILGRTTREIGMFETLEQRNSLVQLALAQKAPVEYTFWAADGTEKKGQFSICEVEYSGAPTLINIIREIC